MKVKVSYILASVAAMFLFALSAKAQEEVPAVETPDPTHHEVNLDEDKTLMYEHPSPSHSSTVKDSLQVVPRILPAHPAKAVKPDAHKNSHKEEEDALSFNFLYYMFQKFKMSDLIDQ